MFSWLSTAAATASACGAAEVVNICRLVCPLRVNPSGEAILGFWSCFTVRVRNAYALLARRLHLPRAPAARAHAARGAPSGTPVPPSQARARLVGCSAR